MDAASAKTVQAYVLNIARRKMRKCFGVAPVISGQIPEGANRVEWNNKPGKWAVELTISDDGVKIYVRSEFDTLKVDVSAIAYPTMAENYGQVKLFPLTPAKHITSSLCSKEFNVADPRSGDSIEEFFTKTLKIIKKDLWRLKHINRDIIEKRNREEHLQESENRKRKRG